MKKLSLMGMSYSEFEFYIKPGKKVVVCYGPYQPMGGWKIFDCTEGKNKIRCIGLVYEKIVIEQHFKIYLYVHGNWMLTLTPDGNTKTLLPASGLPCILSLIQ